MAKLGIRLRLLKLAHWVTHSNNVADHEDLVGDALAVVCDPKGKPWNPPPGFLTHMGNVMRDLFIERCRWGYGRYEVVGSHLGVSESTVDPAPLPDEALEGHRELARLRELGIELRARVAHLPRVAEVFDQSSQGVEEEAEIATRVGCSVEDVYRAHRTLKRYAGEMLEERRKAQAARAILSKPPSTSKVTP